MTFRTGAQLTFAQCLWEEAFGSEGGTYLRSLFLLLLMLLSLLLLLQLLLYYYYYAHYVYEGLGISEASWTMCGINLLNGIFSRLGAPGRSKKHVGKYINIIQVLLEESRGGQVQEIPKSC